MAKATDFTLLRQWWFNQGEEPTYHDLKTGFEDVIEAAGLKLQIQTSGNGLFITGNSTEYMPVSVFSMNEKGTPIIAMGVEGKGQQIKAQELAQYFTKSSGAMSKIQNGLLKSGALIQTFRIGGAAVGIGAGVGMAVRGGAKIIAKGVKALLRDQAAYEREISHYSLCMGLGDFVVGGVDSSSLITRIENRATDNNVTAQYILGTAYAEGRGVEPSESNAMCWFEKAAANGELRGQNIVSGEWLYSEREYGIEKKELAVRYLINLADSGEDWAPQLILDIFGQGTVAGIPIDYDKTIEYAKKYAERGNLYSTYVLAQAHDSSLNPDIKELGKYKDDGKAAFYYKRIVDGGVNEYSGDAAIRLAEMYAVGRGVTQSIEDAISNYTIASQQGNLQAKCELIDAYTFGYGAKKSKEEATRLSNEIIRSGENEYLPVAYYSLFKFADEEERYGESIKQARQYIACQYADPEKRLQLEQYLADKEVKIAQMTDAERRDFLKIPPERKWIKYAIIGGGILLAIIIIVTIISNMGSDEDYIDYDDGGYSDEYYDEDYSDEEDNSDMGDSADDYSAYRDVSTLFDETTWTWTRGQTAGSQCAVLFHQDGTFSALYYGSGETSENAGTWTFDMDTETLYLTETNDYGMFADNEEYVRVGDDSGVYHFMSPEEVEMMDGYDYCYVSPDPYAFRVTFDE